jgi:hypothetical protein
MGIDIVEVFARIHEKFFPESPIMGHLVIVGIGVLAFGGLLFFLSSWGADRFHEQPKEAIGMPEQAAPALPDQSVEVPKNVPEQPQPSPEHEARLDISVSADVVRGDMTNRRPYLRERLGEFIARGEQLKSRFMNDAVSDAEAYASSQRWLEDALLFLNQHMGDAQHNSFRDLEIANQTGTPHRYAQF